MVELQGLPAIKGYIRWSDGEESGVAFETMIPMQIIAGWINGRVSPPPSQWSRSGSQQPTINIG
jgi:hypothetical protein